MSKNHWDHLSLKHRIVYFINYASVFNDALSISDLCAKIGTSNRAQVDKELEELEREGLIVKNSTYVAVTDLKEKLEMKADKERLSGYLLDRRMKQIQYLASLPIIKFVGVSGSLAAGNPAENSVSKVDVDLFLIARQNTVWLVILLAAILRNFYFRFVNLPLCLNYIMEESDLLVYNQNFYTAHELRNMRPIVDKGVYTSLLETNKWSWEFFPELRAKAVNGQVRNEPVGFSVLGVLLFGFFTLLRCVKNFSLGPFRDLKLKFDPWRAYNLSRKSTAQGGYQLLVVEKFKKNMDRNFPAYQEDYMMEILFKDDLTEKIKSVDYDFSAIARSPKELRNTLRIYTKYD
ncbi:MAG: hypothetical protein RIC30_15310 [Marinoscillum sp.]|uniref:hypothetical protein n=1 Tax=Marinoscillum sp. TaxID=2024838 RepID=UPI0032F6996A